jgi:hypothetical protein
MTLQEKIDKLPLSIPHWDELDYELCIEATVEEVCVKYVAVEFEFIEVAEEFTLFEVCNQSTAYNLSQRLEDVVDRALTIIENEEW